MKDKKYIVYKIVNNFNNMIYIGCHVTHDINDKYMGSGTNIKKAIKKYGLENFDKHILYQFDNEIDMLNKEEELVNREFISETSNYNIIVGGRQFLTLDTITVRDNDNNCYRVHKNDERYLSGELISIAKGYFLAKDKNNNNYMINKNDERYLSGDIVGIFKDMVFVKDKNGKKFTINKYDERYLSGELISTRLNKIPVKDKNGKKFIIDKDDERYLSGEFLPIWKNKKHTDDTKIKIGEKNSISQKGEKNSQFGTCWITKEGENKKIKNNDIQIYFDNGWIKGRNMK